MTSKTIPHDHHHHQEMDQLQALAVKPQAKRQVRRRRTHTSRPYQESLLNMAEARREIVTALKIHRASTRRQQQPKYQRHQEPPLRQPPFAQLQQQQEEHKQVQEAFLDRSQPAVDEEASLAHTTMSYAAAAASFANNPLRSSPPAHWIAARSYCSPPPILRLPCDLTPPELPPTAAMGGLGLDQYQYQAQGGLERLVRSLQPAQPLGLNLSFQGFGVSVDDVAKDDCEELLALPLTTQPSLAASYSYSPPAVETATTHACAAPSPALSATDAENHSVIDAPAPAALVPALDGGEKMAQQPSVGEMQQGVEWSEAAAADVAACWSKIFESVESGQHAPRPNAEDVAVAAAGLPVEWWWLCGDDAGVGEQAGSVTGGKPSPDVLGRRVHVNDGDGDYSCCYDYEGGRSDDGEEVTLPCMDDIGDDTQGWDGEWFSCP